MPLAVQIEKAPLLSFVSATDPSTSIVQVMSPNWAPVWLEEASRDLGAGALTTFRSITFPLLAPAHVDQRRRRNGCKESETAATSDRDHSGT